MHGKLRAYQIGSETSTPCCGEEHHDFHRSIFSFLFSHSGQLLLDEGCEDGEVILEWCNEVLLGYMSMCRLFFLSDRGSILVRREQIKVGDLLQRVSPCLP